MRVLYLVPPGRRADQITPHSFLDEEIEGLARTGIQPWVLSQTEQPDLQRGPVRIRAVRRGRWRERARVPRILTQYADAFPLHSIPSLVKAFHPVRLELSAAQLVRSEALDLIHSHFGCAFGLGGFVAARETHRPLVASLRGMDILLDPVMNYGLRRDPGFDRGVRALLRRADMTTYATDFMRRTGIRLGADEATAVTIRKGVDLGHFDGCSDRPALRRSLGFDRPLILTVADLIPRKGIDVILKALARLRSTQDFDLVICGEGPEAKPLARLARQVGLADRTHFLGWVGRDEIPDYFAACDLFILASHIEAAGNVLLEAMAAARPVICTDSGGPSEYVSEGVSGFIVPPGDQEAMAATMKRLIQDPDLADRMGREGRAIAERDYRYDRMISEYLQVYRRARRPRPKFSVSRISSRQASPQDALHRRPEGRDRPGRRALDPAASTDGNASLFLSGAVPA